MHDTPRRAVRRGRHRLVHRRRRLLVATAGIVVSGLSLMVVIDASRDVRPPKGGQSPASIGGEASPTTPPAGGTWAPDVQYAVGAQVTYAGVGYRCRQAHRSLVTWEPPNTPALWQRL